MERFREKDVVIPKTKAFERGSLFLDMMRTELDGMKIVLHIASFQEKYSLMLELLKTFSMSYEFSMYQLVVCIKEASKTVRWGIEEVSNVRVVGEDSLEYAEHLATAAFVFSNDRLPNYYVRRKEQQLVFLPGSHENYSLSQMLNATILVSLSASYTNLIYKEKYGLEHIFRGIVVEPHGGCSFKEYVKMLIDVIILKEKEEEVTVRYFSERKRRVLFVMDMKQKESNVVCDYLSIIQQIAKQEVDVTVVFASALDGWEQEVRRMLPQVHIIVKSGKVSYSEEGYVALERMRFQFSYTDSLEAIFEKRPEKELITEWHRLIGDTTFDYAYLMSPQSVFWYAMFLEVASQKIGIFRTGNEIFGLKDTKTERIYDINTIQVVKLFDKVVTLSYETYGEYKTYGLVQDLQVDLLKEEYCMLHAYKKVIVVKRNKDQYYEVYKRKSNGEEYRGSYVMAKKEGEVAIATLLSTQDCEERERILAFFYELVEREAGIVLYLGVPYVTKKERKAAITVQKKYQGRIRLFYSPMVYKEFFETMDLFLEVGEKGSEKVKYLADIHQKPWIQVRANSDKEELIGLIEKEANGLAEHEVCGAAKEYERQQREEICKILH